MTAIATRTVRTSSAVAVVQKRPGPIATRQKAPRAVIAAGLRGPKGESGLDAPGADGSPIISADPDNRIKRGADGGLHVLDDLTPNPLAYYILARS